MPIQQRFRRLSRNSTLHAFFNLRIDGLVSSSDVLQCFGFQWINTQVADAATPYCCLPRLLNGEIDLLLLFIVIVFGDKVYQPYSIPHSESIISYGFDSMVGNGEILRVARRHRQFASSTSVSLSHDFQTVD